MRINVIVPKWLIKIAGNFTLLWWMTCVGMALFLYLAFMDAAIDPTMGMIRNMYYLYVSSTGVASLALGIVMIASIAYLRTTRPQWDILAYTSAEIGAIFCTCMLMTGILWTSAFWNGWGMWGARLIPSIVLWWMYLGYLLLRQNIKGARGAKYAAVFGIIAVFDVPFVYYALPLWKTNAWHPARAELSPAMGGTLLIGVVAFLGLYGYLLQHRVTLESMKNDLEGMRRILAERDQKAKQDLLIENENFVIEDYTFKEYKKV